MKVNRSSAKRIVLAVGSTDEKETNFSPLHLDGMTHILETITDEHHETHEGHAFSASYAITTAATDGHRSGLYIKTPSSEETTLHMIFIISASTAANYSICEAPTIAANTGTHAVAIYNRYRDNANESKGQDNATSPARNKVTTLSEAEIAGDGTWATGTVLQSRPLEAGSGPKPAGGTTRGTQEWLLKASTAYVLLITNTAALANAHYMEFEWYEHKAEKEE